MIVAPPRCRARPCVGPVRPAGDKPLHKAEGGRVEIIPTTSSWFGVTYKEDAPFVENSLRELINKGEYPEKLWESK